MRSKDRLSQRLAVLALVGGSMLMSNVQPAAAWFWQTKVVLSVSSNYEGYQRSKNIGIRTGIANPLDRNGYCQWKHNMANAKGEPESWFWPHKTRCFYMK
jgi:hypothetical protein